MARTLNYLIILVTSLSLGAVGCGKRSPPRDPVYPVSGKVTINGKPTSARLLVILAPTGSSGFNKKSPSGFTRSDGSFVIATYGDDDGAPAGTYAVVVATTDNGRDAKLSKIVQHYADPNSPAVQVTVKEQASNVLDPIDLKSKD